MSGGVDYCITTMNRPHALERLLLSLAAHRPDASVHVADQSENFDRGRYERLEEQLREAGLREPLTVHRLPFDCGVGVARNHLVDSTQSEYVLSLDDDFVFTERTDVDTLVHLLEAHPEAGVAGGALERGGRIRNRGSRFERQGATLCQLQLRGHPKGGAGGYFQRADCVPLFMLVRKQLFSNIRWDPALKTSEHFDFFLRLQETPYGVLYAPDVTIDHPPIEASAEYASMRQRVDFLRQMMVKHGVTRMKMIGGTVFELRPEKGIAAYCELEQATGAHHVAA